MIIKIINLILTIVLFCLPVLAQKSNPLLGWDLTYSSILKANKIGSKEWIRRWLTSDYKSPAKIWISEWRSKPIISSILIEYPAPHAAERTTMWIFRTKNNAYYWQDIEDLKFSDIRKDLEPQIYDELLTLVSSWQQAKPASKRNPSVSIPGYIGVLSLYDKDKFRQLLLSQEDFITCATKKCEKPKIGRLLLALDPVIPKYETD